MRLRGLLVAALAVGLASGASAAEVTLSAAADGTLFENSGDLANGEGSLMHVGRLAKTLDGIDGPERRALVRFDLSALPAGATVTGATLTLVAGKTSGGAIGVRAERVTQAWGEGASAVDFGAKGAPAQAGDTTWTQAVYPGTAWTTPGGDVMPMASDDGTTTLTGGGAFTLTGPGMVADLNDWLQNPGTNFGWRISGAPGMAAGTAKAIRSREASDPAVRPALLVTFEPAPGPDPLVDNTPGVDVFNAITTVAGNGNTGFGGPIGQGTLYLDSAHDGDLRLGIQRGGGDLNDWLVIYFDTKPGGFADTTAFNDQTDEGRKAVSAAGSDGASTVIFPVGFEADYAVAFKASVGGVLFELAAGENDSLIFVTSWGGIGAPSDATFELDGALADIGTIPGAAFQGVGLYLNAANGFRADEGFAAALPAGNPGVPSTITLSAQDRFVFQTYAPSCGDGVLSEGEACDDGNQDGADGCTPNCELMDGWVCATPGQACTCAAGFAGATCADIDECAPAAAGPALYITGVLDGPLPGGTPKAMELYVAADIADLSGYTIDMWANGNDPLNPHFTFPAVSANVGDFIYVTKDAPNFEAFMGFSPDYTTTEVTANGDDGYTVSLNGEEVDRFGVAGEDATGTAWDYQDGWAQRQDGKVGGPFDVADWTFSGINVFDNQTTNDTSPTPFPVGEYIPPAPTGGAGPCDANATCTNTSGGFECTCDAGFAGDGLTCTAVTGPCSADPCLNGGACTADGDGFVCACAAGFWGATCDQVCACDDSNDCTDDICDGATGCVNTPLTGTACSDDDACTEADLCTDGVCAGVAKDCDDQDVCTDNLCVLGTCSNPPNAAACDDGDACTVVDTCTGGACVGAPMVCDDQNPCTDDVCAAGACASTANTAACDDGDLCTENDACADGVCGGTAMDCADGDPCTVDTCADGACAHGTPDCDDQNPCTDDACVNGACEFTANSAACDDGDACTLNDGCVDMACVGTAKDCDDSEPCTDDVCADGTCASTPNTAPCDDGDGCTTGDACQAGACDGGGALDCDDQNPCTDDACAAGACTHTPNTAGCDDGNPCTQGDVCAAGACGGTDPGCDDGNPCTTDVCNPADGTCVGTADDTATCDDGDACTADDHCAAGACAWTVETSCDDGDACTQDACDANAGCLHTAMDTCDDGDPCTEGDTCATGTCEGAAVEGCCAVDTDCTFTGDCLEPTCADNVCGFAPVAGCCVDDSDCNDNNDATADTCAVDTGTCANLLIAPECQDDLGCVDNDSCTQDTCVAGLCEHTAIDGCCMTDNDCDAPAGTCTIGLCVDSACQMTPLDDCCTADSQCDDGDDCTTDSCTQEQLCVSAPIDGCCLTDEDCAAGDLCDGNRCTPKPADDDTGTLPTDDTGTTGADAGTTGADAGTTGADAGATGADTAEQPGGGASVPPADSSGCTQTAHPGSRGGLLLLSGLLVVLGVLRRRWI